MNAERDCFDPARRSTPARRSFDSVIDVFSFIPSSYYSGGAFVAPAVAGTFFRRRGVRW